MTKVFSIYRLTAPSGRAYVGYTGCTVKERVRQHVIKAIRGSKNPVHNAIRKYGIDNFNIETLSAHESIEEAFAEERRQIALNTGGYNISPGGEEDLLAGRQVFLEKLKDPAWKAAYGKKLSAAIKSSELCQQAWKAFPAVAKAWREANPEAAARIQKQATEAARLVSTGQPAWNKGIPHKEEACKKMSVSQRNRWDTATPEMLAAKTESSKRGAKKQWAQRTPEQKAAVAKKISESLKRKNANMTPEELAKRDAILAETRKNINHDVRKARQKEAITEYWTPERRAEKGEWSRNRHAKLRDEKSED